MRQSNDHHALTAENAPQSPRSWVTNLPVFVAAVVILVSLAPIWSFPILPLQDLPTHLSCAYIWRELATGNTDLARFYELNIIPAPYFLFYGLTRLLAGAMDVRTAGKIVLSCYVLSWPAVGYAWARRTSRPPVVGLIATMLAFNVSWAWGFMPSALGTVVAIAGISFMDRFIERGKRLDAIAIFIFAILCYLSHPIAVLMVWAGWLALAIADSGQSLRRVAAAAGLLGVGPLGLVWQARRAAHHGFSGTAMKFESPLATLTHILRDTSNVVSGNLDEYLLAIVLVATAMLWLTSRRQAGPRPPTDDSTRRLRMWENRSLIIALVMLGFYLFLPITMSKPVAWIFVNGRFAVLAVFYLLFVPGSVARSRRRIGAAIYVAALGAAVIVPINLLVHYAAFNRRVAPFVAALERAPKPGKVLYLQAGGPNDPAVSCAVFAGFAPWVQLYAGGFNLLGNFERPEAFPFREIGRPPLPPRLNPAAFDEHLHGDGYTMIIVRHYGTPLRLDLARWTTEHDGDWTIYSRR